jgi:hypothetical protein
MVASVEQIIHCKSNVFSMFYQRSWNNTLLEGSVLSFFIV